MKPPQTQGTPRPRTQAELDRFIKEIAEVYDMAASPELRKQAKERLTQHVHRTLTNDRSST